MYTGQQLALWVFFKNLATPVNLNTDFLNVFITKLPLTTSLGLIHCLMYFIMSSA